MDSGATHHMCNKRHLFGSLVRSSVSHISLPDKSLIPTKGEGDITLILNYRLGISIDLFNVLYVPGFSECLLSVSSLCCADYPDIGIEFIAGLCIFRKKGVIALKLPLKNRLWYLSAGVTGLASSAKARGTIDLSLWHLRLNHLNKRGMLEMIRKGLLPGVEVKDEDQYEVKCIGCGLGKLHREPHKKVTRQSKRLELIHTDLCGPMDTATVLYGKVYFITFVDDFSRRSWIKLLAHKDEAFGAFQEWLPMVERQAEEKVKVLRSDGGGEYVNRAFREYLAERGIHHQFSNARTPQQNGVAERINRTLMEGVRSMIHGVGLSKGFWGWALECFNYTRNRMPTRGRADGKSPYEAWSGKRPSLSHLKVFGSPVLYRVDDQLRKKLDPKARKGILVGYSANKAGYRIWDRELHRLIDVRELVAYEDIVKKQNFNPRFVSNEKQTDIPLILQAVDDPGPRMTEVTLEAGTGKPSNSGNPGSHPELATQEGYQLEPNHGDEPGADPPPGLNPLSETVRSAPATTEGTQNDELVAPARQTRVSFDLEDDVEEVPDDEVDTEDQDGPSRQEGSLVSVPVNIPDQSVRQGTRLRVPTRRFEYDSLGKPHWSGGAANTVVNDPEPKSYSEVLKSPEKDHWLEAMAEEEDSIIELRTYTEMDPPSYAKLISSKWVFKRKLKPDGGIRYKARVVARGFSQRFGIDFEETYAPTLSYKTFRVLCALAVSRGFYIHQLDIKTAFLYADIDREGIYIKPPPGITRTKPGRVWKLNKGLYGLKQSPRLWHAKISESLAKEGFKKLYGDSSCYSRGSGVSQVIMCLFVDDILLFSEQKTLILEVKDKLVQEYKLSDVGEVSKYLQMQIHYNREAGTLFVEQRRYIEEKLREFDMEDCKPVSTPLPQNCRLSVQDCPEVGGPDWKEAQKFPYRQVIGSLMHMSVSTRPDLAHAMSQLSRFNTNPGKAHWKAALHVLRYLQGTKTVGLRYVKGKGESVLEGFCDSDYAGCPDTRQSTSGFVFKFSGCAVTWMAKRQKSVAQSSSEAEYFAAGVAAMEATWLRNFLSELGSPQKCPITLFSDSTSAISMSVNPVHRERTKHIDVKAHYVREQVSDGKLALKYVHTSVQAADTFTKSLGGTAFKNCRELIGMVASSGPQEESTGELEPTGVD